MTTQTPAQKQDKSSGNSDSGSPPKPTPDLDPAEAASPVNEPGSGVTKDPHMPGADNMGRA